MIEGVGYFDMGQGPFQYFFDILNNEKGPDYLPRPFPDNFAPIEPLLTDWEVHMTPDFFVSSSARV